MTTPEISHYIKPREFTADFTALKFTGEMEKGDKTFVFSVKSPFEKIKLNLSFPVFNGVRLSTDKKGFFDTKDLKKISYEEYENCLKIFTDTDCAVFSAQEDWKLDIFRENEIKFTFSAGNLKFGYNDSKLCGVEITPNREDGENFYGLGERFNSFIQKDRVVLWNSDGFGTGRTDVNKACSYINVPIIHSTFGYCMFLNSTHCAVADFSGNDSFRLTSEGPICDFFVWTDTPTENIESYTSLTGKPHIPPKWAFDYWAGGGKIVWEMNGLSIIPEIVKGWITEYEDMGAVPSALFGEGDPSYNEKIYKYLNEHNVRMLMWNYSGLNLERMRELLPDVDEKDFPVIHWADNPDVYYEDYIDFTHPNATKLISAMYSKFWDWGLKGIMVDFGEYVDWNTVKYNGMLGDETHNLHAYFYNKGHHDAWTERMGNDFVLFARAGCAGSQAYAPNFTGDQASNFEGLREQVRAVMSASSSGFSIIGGDIGGFFTQPPFDVYCRWIQFATFTPLMRAHGCPTGRNPWEWGDNGRNMYKAHYFLRKNISDLIYNTALHSGQTGIPMVKPFAMAFPDNKAVRDTEAQYIFCDSIMVAPVLESGVEKWDVMFPQGSWYNIWTGEKIEGENAVKSVSVTYDRGPVYFKSGLATEIIVGDEYTLASPVKEETAHKALLVTVPDGVVSTDDYILNKLTDGFEIKAVTDSPSAIIIHGKKAEKIIVDGNELEKTEDFNNTGFKVLDNNSTVIKTNVDWRNITVI